MAALRRFALPGANAVPLSSFASPAPICALMRRLLLLRHAKSSWDDPALDDFDRPLNARGRAAAPRMGAHMRRAGLVPDRALVSAARRTRETWALLSQELPPIADVRVSDELYEAPPATLLGLMRAQLEEAPNLLLVGHNPGLQGLALLLAQDIGSAHRKALAAKFPTAGLAVLRFLYEDWADVGPATGVIEAYVTPKSLGDDEADD